jgi:hypothetical protein
MSYVRRTSCPVRAGGTYPALLLQDATNTKKKYRDLFLPTTEVEDDQWWLGSGLILRTVLYSLSFLKDQTISTYLNLVTNKAGEHSERHTRYTPF